MLISKNKRFIFIHIPKNAGQSITSTLLKYCISDLEKPLANLIGHRNYIRINTKFKQHLNFSLYDHSFDDHEKAKDVKKSLGEAYSSYFKFAIVRNPWDWIFSHYSYALKNVRHHRHKYIKYNFNNFNEYIEHECSEGTPGTYQQDFIYDESGNQIVDFIGKFENINSDFKTICSNLNINEGMPHFNQSSKRSYKEYYTKRSKELVENYYLKDIELFGYQF